jgi:SpoVK/Ycf46/Vps4 family AAA+-type ATPase
MKADLLKRLFRAVSMNSAADLERLCAQVVDEERKLGHENLAEQLQRILEEPAKHTKRGGYPEDDARALGTLPKSKRTSDPLVTFRPTETLRHHMVLAASVERRFQRVENEYAARDRLNRFGFVHKRQVLLYGPPGCGKTLGAERLAYNTGLPFYRVRFDSLISSLFGESASNLRRVFDMAGEQPCLLLLDECDFIARSRKNTNDVGEIPRIVNTLLQLMEDFQGSGIIVAATNLTTALDEAMFRRFDDVFEVPLPGPKEVDRLLHESMSSLKTKGLDLQHVVAQMHGQSAAQIVKVAQDCCKLAILEGRDFVTAADFEQALAELYAAPASES